MDIFENNLSYIHKFNKYFSNQLNNNYDILELNISK